jgi:hypothetical protein
MRMRGLCASPGWILRVRGVDECIIHSTSRKNEVALMLHCTLVGFPPLYAIHSTAFGNYDWIHDGHRIKSLSSFYPDGNDMLTPPQNQGCRGSGTCATK